jgi:hypothetical protein
MFLGHHSPAFTLSTYVHLLPDDLPEPEFEAWLVPARFDDVLAAEGNKRGNQTHWEGKRVS